MHGGAFLRGTTSKQRQSLSVAGLTVELSDEIAELFYPHAQPIPRIYPVIARWPSGYLPPNPYPLFLTVIVVTVLYAAVFSQKPLEETH